MPTDKEVKKAFKQTASKNPDQYYATSVLKEEGFKRKQCACKIFYWTACDAPTCGDPACSGGFRFFGGKTPAKRELDYPGVWTAFASHFKNLGYTPIKRYPVVARWRNDTDFVQASIYDFQPYVVSGEVKPPANPLVVPQFCLRFNDIDNVGITGAHYTGFVMIGQHAFMPPEQWNQAKYFRDIHSWLSKGLGLPNKEITFHEDAWAGGGNFGPCMEFFSRGLELGNQVYMMFEQTPHGPRELKLKVLDMGMGHERNAWFTKGAATSYETTFPTVCKKLFHATGIKVDEKVMEKFLPYASYLNVDEIEDTEKTWNFVAQKVGIETKELREKVLPLAALFSVGEHARSLLFAISDGGLPSNVGGGYNLRVILRRALSFIDKYEWNIDLSTLCVWHADYLKNIFPETSEHLATVAKVLEVEKSKYESTKQKTRQIIEKLMQSEITNTKLLELYDSQGISPELVREESAKLGKKVAVPENFYAQVAELHQHKEQEHQTHREEKIDLEGVPETKALYYQDWKHIVFQGKVVKIIGKNIVLDQTAFYPTSGGQLHDIGVIEGMQGKDEVVDIFKQGSVIVHVLKETPTCKVGEDVKGFIDFTRRKQLAQHHSATHIVGAAARIVLGEHINQASAKKTVEKAHIDLTHYDMISEEKLKEIEDKANWLIQQKVPIQLKFYPRTEAEQTFGMGIYQGGAVPGKELRIVNITGYDVQCCGGTHLLNTGDAEAIKILKANKVQDGIVRVTFVAGDAARAQQKSEQNVLEETAKLLQCRKNQVPARAQELFELWKQAVKKKKQPTSLELKATEEFLGSEKDMLVKVCEIYKTTPEHIVKTTERFLSELKETHESEKK